LKDRRSAWEQRLQLQTALSLPAPHAFWKAVVHRSAGKLGTLGGTKSPFLNVTPKNSEDHASLKSMVLHPLDGVTIAMLNLV
jgi:hypothetical protein